MRLQRKESQTRTPPTRHFLAALKTFIKSFDSIFFSVFFSHAGTHLWQPLSAALCDLVLPLARYKDIIRHGVLDQKRAERKEEKVQQRRNDDRILMKGGLASSSSKVARTVKETDAIKTRPVTWKQVGTEGGNFL